MALSATVQHGYRTTDIVTATRPSKRCGTLRKAYMNWMKPLRLSFVSASIKSRSTWSKSVSQWT